MKKLTTLLSLPFLCLFFWYNSSYAQNGVKVGDTAPEFQSKLLRVVEEGEFFPVGAEKPRRTMARIMAGSTR